MGRAYNIMKLKNVFKILVGKPEGKRPLVRPRHVALVV
jgi:hypothetical protein